MKLCIFDKCQIALDLGINVGFKKKAELRRNIIDHGGIVSYIVTRKCSFVVASDPEKCDMSSKCRMAVKYHLPVVSMDYIWDSVQAGKKLSIDCYTIAGKSKSLDFRSGKISASEEKAVVSVRRFAPKPSFNIRSVRVWQAGEADAPQFDEENYEVAKYAVFQGSKKKQEQSTFYTLEIQVASSKSRDENDNEHGPRYRLFSHHGAILDAVAGKPCTQEMRYFTAADQVLAGYTALCREQVNTHRMNVVEGTFMRNVGSRKLQQILAVLESEMGVASSGVQTIVEHIWREAVGEVETVLCIPISSIKLDQIEKAEALLMKLRDVGDVESDVEPILEEFYDTLPHNMESANNVKLSRAWLSQKQDLCQLIRDMVSVSEATSWSTRTGVQAKYRSLRCNITHVEPESEEYKLVSEDILTSVEGNVKINIKNIYAVQRPIEDSAFCHNLDNKRNLFHSSRVENFLGILSRGLLMPKIVVNDFGGKRSDAGMLGSGIYFASAASKSALYSTPSKACGTRMMVVGEVALGRCCDYTAIDTTLRKPPEGYDSVHGVGSKHDNSSAFKDDEYVIYSVNQQRLRYLVEFTIDEELLTFHLPMDDVGMEIDTSLPAKLAEIDLCDVLGVTDPLSRVQPGLVASSADGQVELKAVHVRAKLVDLAAQVVVLQQYHNSSSSAIEAKYVFPLGDGAAVCGFEAFINDRHIVGTVKEKEIAHREYKEAIREGHGAYLMDQDEETPDVFTVSVGNLPPNATVLIKITYVAELQVEAELISFRLPGSVAPWKHDSATRVKTQDKTDTYKVSRGVTTVQVAVEMPFDIRSLNCPTHSIKSKHTASKAVVELREGQDIADGFQLLVGLAEIHVPRMWVERHPDRPDHQACMLTFYPEFEVGSEVKTELVLLLDVSNSMKGTPLQSAKKVALLILRALDPAWTFNVVIFGTRFTELFPSSQAVSEENVDKAEKFIQTAQADMGNTEVFRPLHAYFLLPPTEGATRNVLLVSDGHLNNENSVMADAHDNYHHTRIFTFGVSPTCNIYTLKSLARVSAGSFEFFDTKVKSKWEEKVKQQLNKACQPGLTSVAVEWRQYDDNLPRPVQAPERITALFNGTRQVIYGFVPNCTMAFLSAVVAGQEVSTVVSTAELAITTGLVVHRLTARGVIQDWEAGLLSDDRTHHEVVKMNSKQDIIELSKEYSIVTQFTSFVAIEKRDKDEDMMTKKGPTITDLVSRETVDILDYMGWQGPPEKMEVVQARKERESSFSLVLKTLTGKTMSLTGEIDLKVEDLMRQIEEKEGIPPENQHLICSGIQLEKNKPLAAYNIQTGSVLHLVSKLRGGHTQTEGALAEDGAEPDAILLYDSYGSDSPPPSVLRQIEQMAHITAAAATSVSAADFKHGAKIVEEDSDDDLGFGCYESPTPRVMELDFLMDVAETSVSAADFECDEVYEDAGQIFDLDADEESEAPASFTVGQFAPGSVRFRKVTSTRPEREQVAASLVGLGASLSAVQRDSPRMRSRPPSSMSPFRERLVRPEDFKEDEGGEMEIELQSSEKQEAFMAEAIREENEPRKLAMQRVQMLGHQHQRKLMSAGLRTQSGLFGLPSTATQAHSQSLFATDSAVLPPPPSPPSAPRAGSMLAYQSSSFASAAPGGSPFAFEAAPLKRDDIAESRGLCGSVLPTSGFGAMPVVQDAALGGSFVAFGAAPLKRDDTAESGGLVGSAQTSFGTLFSAMPGVQGAALGGFAAPGSSFAFGAGGLFHSAPKTSIFSSVPVMHAATLGVGFGVPPPQQLSGSFMVPRHLPTLAQQPQQQPQPCSCPPPPPPGQYPPLPPLLGQHRPPPPPPPPGLMQHGPSYVELSALPPPLPEKRRSHFGFGSAPSNDLSVDRTPSNSNVIRARHGAVEPEAFGAASWISAGRVQMEHMSVSSSKLVGSMLSMQKEKTPGSPAPPLHFTESTVGCRRASEQRGRGPGRIAFSGALSATSEAILHDAKDELLKTGEPPEEQMLTQAVSWRACGDVALSSPSYTPTSPSYVRSSTPSLAEEGTVKDKSYPPDSTIPDLIDHEAGEMLLDEGKFKKQKKKKLIRMSEAPRFSCSLRQAIPEKHTTRWESVEAFRERKLAGDVLTGDVDTKRPKTDLGAIESGKIPVVRRGTVLNEWRQQWVVNRDALIGLQHAAKGMWKLDAEFGRQLCIDVNACKILLFKSGIRSFGLTAASELEDLLATVLALLALSLSFITQAEVMSTISFVKDLIAGKTTIEKFNLTTELRDFLQTATFRLGSEFCRAVDAHHPLACSSMELAPDWLTLGVRLLGFE